MSRDPHILSHPQPYFDLIKVVDTLLPFCRLLNDGEMLLLRRVFDALQDYGLILYSDVKEDVIRIQVYDGLEYLEKKVGSRWVLRTPYDILAILGPEKES